ncbi:MAG: carboxypeptidase regulatory-like domain-containing protein [Thiogranum sp.]|nr:carboxypeptidase regulatory-like domain-containing protein [Thiogranum sp.]
MNPNVDKGVTGKSTVKGWAGFFCLIALMTAVVFTMPLAFAAKGKPGPFVKLSGTVTNSLTGDGVAGATVTLTATTATITLMTDASGNYSERKVQAGSYTMEVSASNFTTSSQPVSLLKGTAVIDVALTPVANVVVNASVSDSAVPGAVLQANGSYTILDGSSFVSATWSQTPDEGVPATISDPSIANPTVTLGSAGDYAAHLVQVLKEAPITEAGLPPDLELQPINTIQKGLQDRNQVVAINPHALEEAESVPLIYSVTTSSGTYTAEVDVLTHLPWGASTGVKTVAVNVPVLLLAKCLEERNETTGEYECTDPTAFSWTITQAPGGSSASLTGADTRSPWFTPDVVGTYRVQETSGSGFDLEVHAGRYRGVIDPFLTADSVEFGDGRPVGDPDCTSCHNGGAAPDNFTPWRTTGHAEAFSQGISTNSHFGENCFACHSVGFDQDDAGGMDDTPNYTNFVNELLGMTGPDTWETMLINYPDTARLANIQCENCHGPQDYTEAHRDQPGAPRVSLSADVCGSCHGEPARHGRFQQWLLSNHADYDLARSRGASSGNCARCHSGNGFVAWNQFDFDPAQQVTVSWDPDTVVPQTCATCHNPHDTGTTSGSDETNAKVRIQGDTHLLLAGFAADNVGKGATCMTCHNSRAEYPRNDATWAQVVANNDTADRPHHGVQADLIMGQNAYFFAPTELYPQARGKHSLITDTCVTCHMNKTQPPDLLSYNQAGTNHTFAADPNICSDCHGPSDPSAGNIDAIITGHMDDLQTELGNAYKRMMEAHYPVDVGSSCGPADGTIVTVTDVVWNERATRLNITLSNGNNCGNVNPSSITVDGGAQTLFDVSLASNDGATLKAAWNWSMLNEDQTINGCADADDPACDPPHTARGVHNPDFCIKALTRAIAAVEAVGP